MTPQRDFVDAYNRDGYVFPIRVMSEKAAEDLRRSYESVERRYITDSHSEHIARKFPGYVIPFLVEVIRSPAILEWVKGVLGEDVLVWASEFFIKEASSADFVSWHQDLTYWDLSEQAEVSAWVALTPSTVQNGCMRFLPGSHQKPIVEHYDTFAERNLLSRGQIIKDVDESQAVDVVLRPGEMSLHHGHMFHASNPNGSDGRRIGFVVRYISPSMYQRSGATPVAMLASGKDPFGNFEIKEPPSELYAKVDLRDVHRQIKIQETFAYAGAERTGKRVS